MKNLDLNLDLFRTLVTTDEILTNFELITGLVAYGHMAYGTGSLSS